MALSHLGQAKTIVDIEEDSAEARVCQLFYETTRKKFMRDCGFAQASKFVALSLIAEDPTDEWAYSYGYPSDCLAIIRIRSGSRIDTPDSVVAYRLATIGSTKVILTDMEAAEVEYSAFIDESLWPADMDLAFSYLLAAYIAPSLNSSLPSKTIGTMRELYKIELAEAIENAAAEEVPDKAPEAESIRVR